MLASFVLFNLYNFYNLVLLYIKIIFFINSKYFKKCMLANKKKSFPIFICAYIKYKYYCTLLLHKFNNKRNTMVNNKRNYNKQKRNQLKQ